MRLLIASDVHGAPDSVTRLIALAHELRPEACVLLGDNLYHGPRNPLPHGYLPKDVAQMLRDMPVPIIGIRGNCDAEVDAMLLPFRMAENAWLWADGLRIFALHGHTLPAEPPIKGIAPGTVVLYGHTHVPSARTLHGVHLWNPGSTSLPKEGHPRSYAVYENRTFTVFDWDNTAYMTQHIDVSGAAQM